MPSLGGVRFDGAVLDRQNAEMIAESIPHIVWTASPDGATTYFNRQGTDYTGCPQKPKTSAYRPESPVVQVSNLDSRPGPGLSCRNRGPCRLMA